jgi:hypothetical protein
VTVQQRASDVRVELVALLGEHLPNRSPSNRPLFNPAIYVATRLRLLSEYHQRVSGSSLISGRGCRLASAELYIKLMRLALSIWDKLGAGPLARSTVLANLGMVHSDSLAALTHLVAVWKDATAAERANIASSILATIVVKNRHTESFRPRPPRAPYFEELAQNVRSKRERSLKLARGPTFNGRRILAQAA